MWNLKHFKLACGGMISEANGTIIFPSSDGGLYPHQV
jgi:hypothetical protein